jgi:hypothetical protein
MARKVEITKVDPPVLEVTMNIQLTMSPMDWKGFAQEVMRIGPDCAFFFLKKGILCFVEKEVK